MGDVARRFSKTNGSQRRERLELFARYFAKFLQRIDAGPADDEFIELADGLVGCKIGGNRFPKGVTPNGLAEPMIKGAKSKVFCRRHREPRQE